MEMWREFAVLCGLLVLPIVVAVTITNKASSKEGWIKATLRFLWCVFIVLLTTLLSVTIANVFSELSELQAHSSLPLLQQDTEHSSEFVENCLVDLEEVRDRRDKTRFAVINTTETEMIDHEIDCWGRKYTGNWCNDLAHKLRYGRSACPHSGKLAWKFLKVEIVDPVTGFAKWLFYVKISLQFLQSLPFLKWFNLM